MFLTKTFQKKKKEEEEEEKASKQQTLGNKDQNFQSNLNTSYKI